MSFEASRKHGPFDTRWSSGGAVRSAGVVSGAPVLAADAAEGLDWDAFAARYVGGTRRHNLEALAAYAVHRGPESGTNEHPKAAKPRLYVVPTDPLPPAVEAARDAGTARLAAAVAAVHTWEGEGGYTPNGRAE